MATVMAAKIILERASNGYNISTFQTAGSIAGFIFEDSKSIRTSTIILASFNILAAFATAARILYDCYWASKRSSRSFKASKCFILSIHPAETFPLVLAIGVVIQGLVFAGVQGTGLHSLTVKGCGTIAQFMWPALFILPFIQAVFGVECALRSIRKKAFCARGKYSVAICCGIVVLMLLGTWLYSHLVPEQDNCFASLVWYISRYGVQSLILLSVSTASMLFSAIIIFVRLSMVTVIDRQQRIAASRIVYHNVLGVVSLAFVIPYFVSQTVAHGNIKLSMMATVVLNLSGLMGGLLQFFLRSKTATIPFELKHAGPWGGDKHDVGMTSFNERTFNKQLASPLSEQPLPAELSSLAQGRDGNIGQEKDRVISMESLESSPFNSPAQYDPIGSKADDLNEAIPAMPESVTASLPGSAKRTHMRKGSYSLFPGNAASPVNTSPPTIHIEPISKYSTQNEQMISISDLKPPPPIHFSHRRDSSVISSATVQIGLRISQAPPQTRDTIAPLSIPSNSQNTRSLYPPSSLSPKLIPIAFSFRPGSPPPTLRLAKGPSPLRTNALPTQQSSGPVDPNKTLPPTPKGKGFNFEFSDTIQLSPVAYSPQKEASSPKTTTSNTSAKPRSGAPPSTTSPKRAARAPLPTSPRPPTNLRSETRVHEGWI